MTSTASPVADHKPRGFDRRMLFAGLGILCGLSIGLLIWGLSFLANAHYPVVSATVGLMAVGGVIGFLIVQPGKGKLQDLLTFIVAFFFVP